MISDYCKPTKQAKPSSVCRKYVGGGENPTYSLIFSEMFLFLYIYNYMPHKTEKAVTYVCISQTAVTVLHMLHKTEKAVTYVCCCERDNDNE